jgi:hypothetical protein
MPLNSMSDRQRAAYHKSTCAALTALRADHKAIEPPKLLTLRRTPRRVSTSVVDALTTYLRRDSLPVDVVAHVLASLGEYDVERRVLETLDEQLVEWLYPYYVDRLQAAGFILHTDGSLLFSDVPRISVYSLVRAYAEREHARTHRYSFGAMPMPRLLADCVRIGNTRDLCTTVYPNQHISGLEYSGANGMTTLPRGITTLLRYTHALRASACRLTELQPAIGTEMTHLRVLVLDDNQLRTLPHELGRLSRLETLSIAGNLLDELPSACVVGWTALHTLNVARNTLTQLPTKELANLTLLTTLDVSQNRLVEFPSELRRSSSLAFVSLMHNRPRFDKNEFSNTSVRNGGMTLIASRLQCVI